MQPLQRGFTLIEMMIVVAILAILAAFAVPSYRQYVIKSNRNEVKSDLLSEMNYQEQYFAQNNKYDTTRIITKDGYFISIVASGTVSVLQSTSTTDQNSSLFDTECARFTLGFNGNKRSFSKDLTTDTTDKCW